MRARRRFPGPNGVAAVTPPGLWAVVPVKPFAEAKSRLAPLLDGASRAALSRALLSRTLRVVTQADCCAGLVVVSRDVTALALAEESGAVPLREDGHDLNAALEQARRFVVDRGAQALLVLPADLAAVEADDIRSVAALADDGRSVVVAPSSTGGTNLLLLRPPGILPFAYGPGSFDRHVQRAADAGLPVQIVRSPVLALDLDLPGDLAHPLLEAISDR